MFQLFLSEGILCYDGRTSREVKKQDFSPNMRVTRGPEMKDLPRLDAPVPLAMWRLARGGESQKMPNIICKLSALLLLNEELILSCFLFKVIAGDELSTAFVFAAVIGKKKKGGEVTKDSAAQMKDY